MRNKAFTIIEVMVYLFIFTLISLSLGRLIVQTKKMIVETEAALNEPLKRALLCDVIRRDIRDDNRENDVLYYAKANNNIYRAEGRYDHKNNRWLKKACCLVGEKCADVLDRFWSPLLLRRAS